MRNDMRPTVNAAERALHRALPSLALGNLRARVDGVFDG